MMLGGSGSAEMTHLSDSAIVTATMSGFPCGGWYPVAYGKVLRDCPYGEMMKRYPTPQKAIDAGKKILLKRAKGRTL
jgi:hypothetical protein